MHKGVNLKVNIEVDKKRLEEAQELIINIIKLIDEFNNENEKAPVETGTFSSAFYGHGFIK